MPERIYFGKNLAELKAILESLRGGLASGGVTDLQVSGIRTHSGTVSNEDRRALIADCRMEGYRVAQAMQAGPDKDQAVLAWPDPRKEKIMRVESVHGCYPFPPFPCSTL